MCCVYMWQDRNVFYRVFGSIHEHFPSEPNNNRFDSLVLAIYQNSQNIWRMMLIYVCYFTLGAFLRFGNKSSRSTRNWTRMGYSTVCEGKQKAKFSFIGFVRNDMQLRAQQQGRVEKLQIQIVTVFLRPKRPSEKFPHKLIAFNRICKTEKKCKKLTSKTVCRKLRWLISTHAKKELKGKRRQP